MNNATIQSCEHAKILFCNSKLTSCLQSKIVSNDNNKAILKRPITAARGQKIIKNLKVFCRQGYSQILATLQSTFRVPILTFFSEYNSVGPRRNWFLAQNRSSIGIFLSEKWF